MTTLADLERKGKAALLKQRRIAEEKQRQKEEADRHDRMRMFNSVLYALAEHSGVDAEELRPLLRVDRQYWHGDFTATLEVPDVDPATATIRFNCVAARVKGEDYELIVTLKRDKPFYFTWRNPTYYTLGEALAVARARQEQADAYDREQEENDRRDDEAYLQREAKKLEERNDRVTFLASLVDEHPILFPLLKVLVAYLNREADLQDELEAVANY